MVLEALKRLNKKRDTACVPEVQANSWNLIPDTMSFKQPQVNYLGLNVEGNEARISLTRDEARTLAQILFWGSVTYYSLKAFDVI